MTIQWRVAATGLLSALCLSLTACAGGQSNVAMPIDAPHPMKVGGGMDVLALNYTPWYIHTFSIIGPSGIGIGGGGPNVMSVRADGRPFGGGKAVCCMNYPVEWQPDLKLTVRWLVEKKRPDGKTWGYWYKAENVRIAQYNGANANETWGIFLPGDRVRVMITDGNHDGGNNPNNRPADTDPYIAQGVIDEEWNRLYRKGGMR
ncbi:DUF3304 domain-containing protein [Burkholderia vietnamiensis]|uniref:DUF3304 domain-containing protein n=1 Tax=Burkholderia vietnamiensis TaxID=60552 RepID=UPI0009BFBB31|nr:DUF3304 domain-containing protein [Burkholderia vietnamiensis]MCA8446652.1 DUF3304 domain-containing protein [Burkholderia vietnamiensis]MDN7665075.1 DUF3304 domain-containing protein [Burkholderia vietnamiensis]HDR8952810.1 DUF3304 domain-containing protein [Burkholderia vietnamiensis]